MRYLFVLIFATVFVSSIDAQCSGGGCGSSGGGGRGIRGGLFQRRSARMQTSSYSMMPSQSYQMMSYQTVPMTTYRVVPVPYQAEPLNQTPKGMIKAKFAVGQHVKHSANGSGLFPTGSGVIVSVTPWNTSDGYSYQLRCDATGRVLPVNFKETELIAD